MTLDEAMALWAKADRAGEDAYVEAIQAGAVTADDAHKTGSLAAATVIQQAFAERDGEDRMALQIIANPDWTWATVAEMREIARQALAAEGDSRG